MPKLVVPPNICQDALFIIYYKAAAEDGYGEERGALQPRRILLLEQDTDNLRLMEALLTAKGYEVTAASEAKEALKQLEVARFDIIVADIEPSTLDGAQLLDRVRQLAAETPLFLAVGFHALEAAVAALVGSGDSSPAESKAEPLRDSRRFMEHLLKAERRRTLFSIANGLAHHLNNALTPILGNAELMLNQQQDHGVPESAESRQMLQEIIDRSLQATRLIWQLQELFAFPAGKERELVDINHLLRMIVEATKPWWQDELRRDGRTVDVVLEPGDIQPLYGDVVALREALLQLLINAVEAIPSQGRVEIRTEGSARETRIMFIDNGIGIPEEVQGRIFEPFVTTKGPQRAGLGLSTVQAVAADHQGNVEVFTQEGAGTTIIVTLPSTLSPPGPEKAPSLLAEATEQDIPESNILVIEDEEPVRQLLATVLEKEGQHVTAVASGPEGLAAFRKGNYPVVFTDWGMDAMSGLQVAQKIKEMAPATRVVLVTGWATQLDHRRAREWCVDYILTKPFTIEQVRRRLRDVLLAKGEG